MQVPAHGGGTYICGVDHRPHDGRLLVHFNGVPRVTAHLANGRMVATHSVRHDRLNDANIFLWDVQRGAGVAYYRV